MQGEKDCTAEANSSDRMSVLEEGKESTIGIRENSLISFHLLLPTRV